MRALVGVLGTILSFGPAMADTIVITASFDVAQNVEVLGAGPVGGYFVGDDLVFPQTLEEFVEAENFGERAWDEDRYVQILNRAGVWDSTQITTDPIQIVTSRGSISGMWTVDIDALKQDLTGFADRTSLGSHPAVSTFLIDYADLDAPELLSADRTRILVDNKVGNTPGGDRIWIEARLEGGLKLPLILSGDKDWFESAADDGTAPDFSRIQDVELFIETIVNDGNGNPEYRTTIKSIEIEQFTVQNLGAADGLTPDSPLLPDEIDLDGTDPAPTFGFDLSGLASIGPDRFIWIDPLIARGYLYELTGGGLITGIMAPTFDMVPDRDGYLITLPDGSMFELQPGATQRFGSGVTSLQLTGIDLDLMLDPSDMTAFMAAFTFDGLTDTSRIAQTALTAKATMAPVPLPAGGLLLLSATGALAACCRMRKARV